MAGKSSLVVLLIMAGISVVLIGVLLAPFLRPVSFAVILAIAFQPLHARLAGLIRRRVPAALAATLAIVLVVMVPLWALGGVLIQEARGMYANLAEHSAQEGGWGSYAAQMLERPVQWAAQKTGVPAPNVRAALLEKARSLSAVLVEWGGSLLGNLTATLGNGVLSLFVLFFLFLEGEAITTGIYGWMPLPRERTGELLKAVADSIVANLYGIAAVGSVQGVLTGIGLLIAGVGSPVLWGAVAAGCSLIPIVGTALVWVPACLYLLVQGAWGKALFLVVWGVLVVGMSDNFVRPWVLKGRTEMNTLVVFFALMGGMQAFGFIGIFAGPVIFSVAMAVFRMLREEYAPAEEAA